MSENKSGINKGNLFKGVAAIWAGSIGASLTYAFLFKKSLPLNQKVIHARIYAQAATITSLVGAAGVLAYDSMQQENNKGPKETLSMPSATGHRS